MYYYPAPGRGGRGIVVERFLSFCLFSLFVSLSATLRENGWTDLREIFREGMEWPWDDLIQFWVNSGKWVGGSKVKLFVITGHSSEALTSHYHSQEGRAFLCPAPQLIIIFFIKWKPSLYVCMMYLCTSIIDEYYWLFCVLLFSAVNAKWRTSLLLKIACYVTLVWHNQNTLSKYATDCWILLLKFLHTYLWCIFQTVPEVDDEGYSIRPDNPTQSILYYSSGSAVGRLTTDYSLLYTIF